MLATHGAEEGRVIGEHPAVGRHQVVAGAIGGGADTHDGSVQPGATSRALEGCAEGVDATIGAGQPVATGGRIDAETDDGGVDPVQGVGPALLFGVPKGVDRPGRGHQVVAATVRGGSNTQMFVRCWPRPGTDPSKGAPKE